MAFAIMGSMNAIYLPGNSSLNKRWANDMSRVMKPLFARSYVHNYLHWDTKDSFVEFDLELAIVSEKAIDYEPYVVIAKSVGALLAAKGIYEGALFPEKCVLLGLPHELMQKPDYPTSEWFKQVSMPCLVLQNAEDPSGSYKNVSSFLDNCNNKYITHKKLAGDNHIYDKYDTIHAEITRFLK